MRLQGFTENILRAVWRLLYVYYFNLRRGEITEKLQKKSGLLQKKYWIKQKVGRCDLNSLTTLCIYLCVFTCSMISLLFMAPCCRGDISIAMAMSIDAWNPPVWYSSNYLSVLGSLRVRMSGETDRCCQKKRKKGVQMEMRDNCRQEGKIRERN